MKHALRLSSSDYPKVAVLAIGLVAVSGALGLAVLRTYQLETRELEYTATPRSIEQAMGRPEATAVSARLGSVPLAPGARAVFEVCSADPLTADRWLNAVEFAVFRLPPVPSLATSPNLAPNPGLTGPANRLRTTDIELMLRVPLDAAHLRAARRSPDRACLPLGGGVIEAHGQYTIDVLYPEKQVAATITSVQLQARVLSRHPLGPWEKALVAQMGLGALLITVGLWWLKRAPPLPPMSVVAGGKPGHLRTLAWPAGSWVLVAASTTVPLFGSTLGLVKGVLIGGLQLGLALWLTRHSCPSAALNRPTRWPQLALVSITLGWALSRVAPFLMSVVPSTGTAPLETFISWPSGMLSLAALGLLLPIAEELFFRGYLYGALLPLGRVAACATSYVAFVVLHVQQSSGNWGALLSVAATGLVLTALRAITATTLAPLLAHLVYNGLLTASSLGA